MRKVTLVTLATILSCACFAGSTLTVNAATKSSNRIFRCGNRIIISNIGNQENCNLNSLLEQLLQCKPSLPSCPPTEAPDTESTPDSGTTPDTDTTPEVEKPEVDTPENNETLSYMEQVVNLVNIERAKEGLAPLTMDTKISAAAQVRAKECEQSFSHTRPDGRNFATALKEQNLSYRRAGENIAWGQRSPEEVVKAWMNSAGHRANIMNTGFTKIGVGYYQNTRGTNYWCQLFTN